MRDYVPSGLYVNVLTPRTAIITEFGVVFEEVVKLNGIIWVALCQYDQCPYKKRRLRHTCTEERPSKNQGERPQKNQPH